jgi:hypothetical protein
LIAVSDSTVASWRNYFSQQLNIHGVDDVRHTQIHTAQLVPEPCVFEIELAFKIYKVTNHQVLIKSQQN